MNSTKVAIVGAGPVGSILAVQLIQNGIQVALIDPAPEHMGAIGKGGIVIQGANPRTVTPPTLFASIDEAAAAAACFDVVYICVKATVNKLIADRIMSILAEDGAAVSFQNGLDTETCFLETLGPAKTLRGVINYAGNVVAPGIIRETFFNPPNYVGAADTQNREAVAKARQVVKMMDDAGMATVFSDDIKAHVWEKVIRNAALMPISALTGMDIIQVVESLSGLALVEAMLTEAMAVCAKLGYPLDQKYYDDTLNYFRKAGHHMPSMWGDVQDGRQTEIEFLNHKIAEYGEKLGVPVPHNRSLANLLLCVDEVLTLKNKQ